MSDGSVTDRRPGERFEALGVAFLGGVLAALPAADRGGYFPGTWAWLALATFFAATCVLIALPVWPLRRLELTMLALFVAFGGWILLSTAWAPAFTNVANEAMRVLAYLGALLLALLVLRRHTVEPFLVGTLLGVVAVSGYAVLTRIFPEHIGSWDPATGYRLADPIGYWNGLGIYSAMGVLLAVGLVARSNATVSRMVAAPAPPILATAMLFTFSRGAWLGLAIGLLVVFAFDPRRLHWAVTVLLLAPWPALVIAAVEQSNSLPNSSATIPALENAGEKLFWVILAAAALSALTAAVLITAERRLTIPVVVRKSFAVVLVVLALGGVVAVSVEHGAPWTVASSFWHDFKAPPKTTGENLTNRLFDLSSTGRIDLWRVSWQDFRDHPANGTGAGSFEVAWAASPRWWFATTEGHSLYLETLGELGVVGLALLIAMLAVPLVAFARVRREPLAVIPLGAYVAFLAHAGVDWDWELAGVTVVALLCGATLLVEARKGVLPVPLGAWPRIVIPVVTGLVALASVPLVVGYASLDRARFANEAANWPLAYKHARRAVRWQPWSAIALQQLARAETGLTLSADAKRHLDRAIDRAPDDYELWVDLANVSKGRAAVDAMEHAVALAPRNEQLRETLAAYRARAAEH